jgi:hypothetical protein
MHVSGPPTRPDDVGTLARDSEADGDRASR